MADFDLREGLMAEKFKNSKQGMTTIVCPKRCYECAYYYEITSQTCQIKRCMKDWDKTMEGADDE